MDTRPISQPPTPPIISPFPQTFLFFPPSTTSLSPALSVSPGCPPLFHSLAPFLFFVWVALGPSALQHTLTPRACTSHSGANDKINYQQAKGLALHFLLVEAGGNVGCLRGRGGHQMERETGGGDKKKMKDRSGQQA